MSVKVKMAPNRAATAMTGSVSGSVISKNRRQNPAPSTIACSWTSPGMATRPAMIMTAASGTKRHTCTAMTEAIASRGRPNQYMFP